MSDSTRYSIVFKALIVDEQGVHHPSSEDEMRSLDGLHLECESLSSYLDWEIAVLGVIGGKLRLETSRAHELSLIVDYWTPAALSANDVERLRQDTTSQISDGVGESGWPITLAGNQVRVVADDVDSPTLVEVSAADLKVPRPSEMAIAAQSGDLSRVKKALARGDDVNGQLQGFAALHLSILYGNAEVAVTVIDGGADTNFIQADGNTALHCCALSVELSPDECALVVRRLVESRANPLIPNAYGESALDLAEIRNNQAMLAVLKSTP